MLALLLAACHEPVIGMEIDATVTCTPTGGDSCAIGSPSAPCRCAPHRFDRPAGTVSVYDARLRDDGVDPTVVFTVEYDSEFALCGEDDLVFHQPQEVDATDGTPLYTVDADASLVPVDDAPLVSSDADTLVFSYPVEGGTVEESHTVRFRDAMELHKFSAIPCCGSPIAPSAGLGLFALGLVVRRRR